METTLWELDCGGRDKRCNDEVCVSIPLVTCEGSNSIFWLYVEVFATIQAFAITLDRTPHLSKCYQRALSCMAVVDC